MDYELLIKNARIIDGTGNPGYDSDLAISKGRIEKIGPDLKAELAEKTIDADGMMLSPGFIDTHTHDDGMLFFEPDCQVKVQQGVTSVVIGNCGFSLAPLPENRGDELKNYFGLLGAPFLPEEIWQGMSFAQYLQKIASIRPGINVIPLVGHHTLRLAAMGMDSRAAEAKEMDRMIAYTEEAMQSGAFGFSTGLNYPPGCFAASDELVKLLKIVAAHGGIHTSHMRDESDKQLDAIEEVLNLSEQSGVRTHISHHKVMGKSNWGDSVKSLQRMIDARAEGFNITCDQYPYIAASTFLAAALPLSFQAGGPEVYAPKLKDSTVRQQLIDELENPTEAGMSSAVKEIGLENVYIANCKTYPSYVGRSLSEIAGSENLTAYDIFFDVIHADKMEVTAVVFMMNEKDLERIMKNDFTMFGSDDIPVPGGGNSHPRIAGTFPKILADYVRDKKILTLEDAIRKMTSLPAETFGIHKKGLIQESYDADLVIFDSEQIKDRSTYEQPDETPVGIRHVIINGEIATDQQRFLSPRSGKVLKKSSTSAIG